MGQVSCSQDWGAAPQHPRIPGRVVETLLESFGAGLWDHCRWIHSSQGAWTNSWLALVVVFILYKATDENSNIE